MMTDREQSNRNLNGPQKTMKVERRQKEKLNGHSGVQKFAQRSNFRSLTQTQSMKKSQKQHFNGAFL